MLRNVLKNQNGNLLMEVLVVLVVVGVLLTSSSAFPYTLTRTSVDLANRQVAQTYASEAISALRGIQNDNWILIPNSPFSNPYHIEKNSSGWFLTTGSETIGNYRREIIFSDVLRDANGNISAVGDVDPNTKKAAVTVFWNSGAGELSTKLSTLVSNWRVGYGEELLQNTIARWSLDENSGNIAYDGIGNNNGILLETNWTPGILGRSVLYDSLSSQAEIPYDEILALASPFTIEFWVKPISDGILGDYNVIYREGSYGFNIGANSISAGVNGNVEVSGTLNNRIWNYVALTYDQTLPTDHLNLFVNGELVSSAIATNPVIESSNSLFLAKGFLGYLDEISIYNYVLDSSLIQSNYDNSIFPVNLYARWDFDEAKGVNLYDTIRTSNGLISGATWTTGRDGSGLFFNGIDNFAEQNAPLVTIYPFAISGWINTSAINTSDMIIFSLADSTKSNRYYDLILMSDGHAGVVARNPKLSIVASTTDLRDSSWHFLTGVFASETDRRIYVDGILQGIDNSSVSFITEVDRWSIGRSASSNPGSYFEGSTDSFSVWNSDLTDQDVLDLYNSY